MISIGNRKINFKILFFLLCIAGCAVLFCSFSTSPLYPDYWGSDSAQFQTIGKAWAEGRIPYLDIFDHKGPIIFWINMLGYRYLGRNGVVLCQIVFFFFTLLGIYKITLYGSQRQIIRWGSLGLVVASILEVYSNGNMCEEYCLPFLMFSAYGQYSYLKNIDQGHNMWWGFFYGITVAVAILTRATNAIPVLCGITVIVFVLIKTKQYYDILRNAISFLLGGGIILGIFSVYFMLNGAFDKFLYGTITYNIIYTKNMQSWVKDINLYMIMAYIRFFYPAIVCFPAFILALYNKNSYLASYYFLVGFVENFFFCKGAFYHHYVIIALPNVIMFIVEFEQALHNNKGKIKEILSRLLIVILIICLSVSAIKHGRRVYANRNKYQELELDYEILMQDIPNEDLNKVMAYGNGTLKDFYLRYNIIPCYKYFVLQDAHGNRSLHVANDIQLEFSRCDAKWILADENTEIISQILENYYVKYKKAGIYTLYKLKNT